MDFLAVDWDNGWGNETESHLITSHLQHRDPDAISDDDSFSLLPAENQHYLLPPVRGAETDPGRHRIAPRD
jgi:hypothetical protein